MKIEYTTGCIQDSLDIDGENFQDCSPQLKRSSLEFATAYLCEHKISEDDLQDLLIWICERFGITEHQYHCEECGDDVYKTTLSL